MDRFFYVIKIFLFLLTVTVTTATLNGAASDSVPGNDQDTVYSRQLLYNGRVWENRYQKILSHEFFLTRNPVSGSVTINRKAFYGILLRYDLYNDELLLLDSPDTYLQLNKEAVSDFVMEIDGKQYIFENFDSKKPGGLNGYGQVIWHGDTWLIKKHKKEIKYRAVDNIYDSFTESQSVWLVTEERAWPLSGRKDLYRALSDRSAEVKRFVRDSGIRFRIKEPESVIPVLKFYDSLRAGSEE
jgi:hypothetical protein